MKTLSSTTWQIPAHIRLGRFISSTATSLAASMVAPAVSSMTEGIRKPLGRFLNIGGDGRGHADGMCVEGPSLQGEELHALMKEQQEKFTDPAIAHNFKGWNKTMLYYFPDIDEYYVLP